MKIEYTENADLDFNSENYEELNRGVVIFPENLDEAEGVETLKKSLDNIYKTQPLENIIKRDILSPMAGADRPLKKPEI